MAKEIGSLIQELAANLSPVQRIPRLRRVAGRALLLAAATTALGLLVLGQRSDLLGLIGRDLGFSAALGGLAPARGSPFVLSTTTPMTSASSAWYTRAPSSLVIASTSPPASRHSSTKWRGADTAVSRSSRILVGAAMWQGYPVPPLRRARMCR